MLTLIATGERETSAVTEGDESEIRGVRESNNDGQVKWCGWWKERFKKIWGEEEEEDEDEEELKEDSPEGPGVVLEELRFEVGEEEMS